MRCDECRLTGSETTSLRNRVKLGVETGEEAGASRHPADTTQLEGNLLRPFKTQTTIIDNELTQLRRTEKSYIFSLAAVIESLSFTIHFTVHLFSS